MTCPIVPDWKPGDRDIYCVSTPSTPGYTGAVGVAISDVARFAPSPGRLMMEPNGWAVVGTDTNFYATARQQTVPGTLLGSPVQVRFTPVGFRWDYGDGATRTGAVAGSSWAAAGIREFRSTPTGHRYAVAGDYSARLTVSMRADFSFDGATWNTVPGALDLAAPAVAVHAATADTVLVEGTCDEGSGAPGC